jgi:hypothetical protein
MTNINEMIEQQTLEYESRQKHTDELLGRAREYAGTGPEHEDTRLQIDQLAREHERLSGQLDQLKSRAPEDWEEEQIDHDGPMAAWDILAQDLEKLVERLTKH